MSLVEAHEFVNLFFEEIATALENGEQVKLSGLGTFSVREKVARPGRNPRTGEPAEVSARKVVTFKASKSINRQLREDGN